MTKGKTVDNKNCHEQTFLVVASLFAAAGAVIFLSAAFEGAGMIPNTFMQAETYGSYSARMAVKTLLFGELSLAVMIMMLFLAFYKAGRQS